MTNAQVPTVFLGLSADEWKAADGLPFSPMVGRVLTVEDVKAGIGAMLRWLNEDGHA